MTGLEQEPSSVWLLTTRLHYLRLSLGPASALQGPWNEETFLSLSHLQIPEPLVWSDLAKQARCSLSTSGQKKKKNTNNSAPLEASPPPTVAWGENAERFQHTALEGTEPFTPPAAHPSRTGFSPHTPRSSHPQHSSAPASPAPTLPTSLSPGKG